MEDAKPESDPSKNILEIRRFYAMGYSDTEIMRRMSLSEDKFLKYREQIITRDKETFEKFPELMAHEIIVLKERLEHTVANCTEIASWEFIRPRERLDAEGIKVNAAVDIVRLLKDGPEAMKLGHGKENKRDSDRERSGDKEK